jgi:transcriptional regulator with XRE-family HTH domain
MQTIGKYLQENRKNKNITIKSLSQRTKVNQRIIVDLENNDFSNLPQLPYLKCFLRSFSEILDLEVDFTEKLLVTTYEENLISEKLIPTKLKKSKNIFLIDTLVLISLFKYIFNSSYFKRGLALCLFSYLTYSLYGYIQHYSKNIFPPVGNNITYVNPTNFSIRKKFNVIIIASKSSSWITLKIEKDKSKSLLLKKGEHFTLKVDNGNIIIGNPNSLHFYVNGNEIDLKLHSKPSGIAKVQFSENKPFIKTTIARDLAFEKE